MDRVLLRAKGKINLGLDVLSKRADGYHEVVMIMQSIDLWDEIELEKSEEGIELTSDMPGLPKEEGNIAYRAAVLLKDRFKVAEGVKIHIDKRIPIGAGMGGGSADCAGVLVGLNKLWDLGLSLKELEGLGKTLGADVPFCIKGGTALAEGIGERLTPLKLKDHIWMVVVKPKFSVSTGEVYGRLNLQNIKRRPDIPAITRYLGAGDNIGISKSLVNVLETVTIPMHPEIEEIKTELLRNGALGSLMTGSGPSVFGIFQEEHSAREAAKVLDAKYGQAHALKTADKGILFKL